MTLSVCPPRPDDGLVHRSASRLGMEGSLYPRFEIGQRAADITLVKTRGKRERPMGSTSKCYAWL